MKTVTLILYQCEICKQAYETEIEAKRCESVPITQDKGVKVGDKVRILYGDGAGKILLVENLHIVNRSYGHNYYERYWHTVALSGEILDERGGNRYLTWDQYEVL